MKIVNLSAKKVLNGLSSNVYDYYRVVSEYDKNNMLGLYYKDLLSQQGESLDERIATNKFCWDQEYTWEHYRMNRLFSLINRLEEVYKEIRKTSELKSPVITGIALYNNYPVGALYPKKLEEYVDFSDLLDAGISYEEKYTILRSARRLLNVLMEHDVYACGLYRGNIKVNPTDYADVRLDGLDGPGVVRVESKEYVSTLMRRRLNLKQDTLERVNKII